MFNEVTFLPLCYVATGFTCPRRNTRQPMVYCVKCSRWIGSSLCMSLSVHVVFHPKDILCINWAGWRQQSVKSQITPGEPMKKVLLWLMDAFGSNVACWFRKHHTFFPWSFTTVFKEDIPECSKLWNESSVLFIGIMYSILSYNIYLSVGLVRLIRHPHYRWHDYTSTLNEDFPTSNIGNCGQTKKMHTFLWHETPIYCIGYCWNLCVWSGEFTQFSIIYFMIHIKSFSLDFSVNAFGF